MKGQRVKAGLLSVWMLCSCFCWVGSAQAAEKTGADIGAGVENEPVYLSGFLQQHPELPAWGEAMTLSLEQTAFDPSISDQVTLSDGKVTAEGEEVAFSWTVEIPRESLFYVSVDYTAQDGPGNEIRFALEVDGAVPYQEFASVELERPRCWVPGSVDEKGSFLEDERGNHPQPEQLVSKETHTKVLRDAEGVYSDPLPLLLTGGTHQLTFRFETAGLTIEKLALIPGETLPDYNTYRSEMEGAMTSGQEITVEGEHLSLKSATEILPVYDKSSCATSPSAPASMLLNAVGGTSWKENGQWIEWDFYIPETGYYLMSFRALQNFKYGMTVFRRVTVDGVVPFAQLDALAFPYAGGWYTQTAGGDTPYQLWLEKGDHTLRMEIVSGPYEEVMLRNDALVDRLQQLYRRIIVITGTSPDSLRDYQLEKNLPGLTEELTAILNDLQKLREDVESGLIGGGSETNALRTLCVLCEGFVKDTETIPYKLSTFKSGISALADWSAGLAQQPLQLDRIVFRSADVGAPAADGGFFGEIWYQIQAIFFSFFSDYGVVGNIYDDSETLRVWINLGRDQLQVLKSLTDRSFIAETGIPVQINLVQGGLAEAIMANSGPDVALFVGRSDPVNFAARNALVDLKTLEGYDEAVADFYPDTLIPYTYKDGVYGMPCTVEIPVMFVRSDILADMALDVPRSWDELRDTAAVLRRNNLDAGIPSGIVGSGIYPSLLAQRGVTLFNEAQTATRLSEEAAVAAFSEWTDLYTKYGFTLSYDFFNRFRSGEMPLGIAAYTTANYIKAAAPELAGLWEMHPIPATVAEDGTLLEGAVSLASTAAILLKGDREEEGWEYLKWFVSAQTQGSFGNDVEGVLGPSGRYATANRNALSLLPWSKEERNAILAQWDISTELEVIPASYIVDRNLSNAFKKVAYYGKNPRETLNSYNFTINQEIERKNQELAR